MNTDLEVSIEQEVADVKMGKPHVVVLGAGASRQTCPKGDKNHKILPLMKDFTEAVGLKPLLNNWSINSEQNFEEIFSDLYEKNENDKITQIENAIEKYFDQLELPDKPTIYDHLVLSLREKDLITTFNWDPLLMHAYLRNSKAGLKLPRLAFLHGNIRAGYCEKDKVAGLANMRCRKCGKIYKRMLLLYPIKKKDYSKDLFIANEWKQLEWGFENAFMITIFGYSGPKTDTEAIDAMKKAWGDKNQRAMEQTAFITTQSDDEVSENWKPFIHTHHYEIVADFYNSWIANHPRRTGEAYLNQYLEAKFITNNPIPRDLDFQALWKWYKQFNNAENNAKIN
jgi:hypothetical protein